MARAMPILSNFLSEFDSKHTRRAYRTDLHRFLREMEMEADAADFAQIDTKEIEAFLGTLKEEGLSTSTIRRRMAAVRRFFDWLVSMGHLSNNPCRAASLTVSASEEKAQSPAVLTKEDLRALQRAADDNTRTGTRDRALILLIVYGALRRSEVASLHVEDVRPLGRHWVIDLPRRGQVPGGYIKIPERGAEAVQDLVEVYGEETGPLWRSFSNRNWGEQMSPDALYKRVRQLGKKANLDNVDIQTLRRSALHLASDAGASLEQIRDHARLQRETSAVAYTGDTSEASRLQSTAVDFLEIDV